MAEAPNSLTISPKRILLVEDEPTVADAIKVILKTDRHSVEVAGSGESALELLEAGRTELVITDFNLPGMDGLQLADCIRKRWPATKILMVTAHWEGISQNKSRCSSVDGLLAKPFQVTAMLAAVAALFPGG